MSSTRKPPARKKPPAAKKQPPQRKKKQEYEETPNWGTAFQRPDNEPPQPQFTGTGVLDDETLEQITAAGGEFQVAIWTQDRDGRPLKNRNGTRRFRLHIEPPWQDDDQDDDEDDEYDDQPDDEDDLPF